jgi:hypothetical protein
MTPGTGCAGPNGGGVTSTTPEDATTCGKRPETHEDHDLRLEY